MNAQWEKFRLHIIESYPIANPSNSLWSGLIPDEEFKNVTQLGFLCLNCQIITETTWLVGADHVDHRELLGFGISWDSKICRPYQLWYSTCTRLYISGLNLVLYICIKSRWIFTGTQNVTNKIHTLGIQIHTILSGISIGISLGLWPREIPVQIPPRGIFHGMDSSLLGFLATVWRKSTHTGTWNVRMRSVHTHFAKLAAKKWVKGKHGLTVL